MITLPQSPVPAQLSSGVRDFLKIIGTAFATKGVYDGSVSETGIGLLLLIGPIIWSQFSARFKHRKMVAAAKADPGQVVVK